MTTTAIADRKADLIFVTEQLMHEHEAWANSNDSTILPDSPFWQALDDFCTAFAYGDLPESCRKLDRIAGDVSVGWNAYKRRYEETLEPYVPPNTFWQPFQLLPEAIHASTIGDFPLLPTPRHYAEREKLNESQIARLYEWKDDRGEYDVAKVRREIDNPSEQYQHGVPDPRNAARAKQRDEANAKMLTRIKSLQARKEAANKPAPESIEELLAQGVSAEQICKIKEIDLQSLITYCQSNSLKLPESAESNHKRVNPVPPRGRGSLPPKGKKAQATADEVVEDEESNELDEEDEIDDEVAGDVNVPFEVQVIQFAEANAELKSSEIAELFSVTPQKVTAILRRKVEILAAYEEPEDATDDEQE